MRHLIRSHSLVALAMLGAVLVAVPANADKMLLRAPRPTGKLADALTLLARGDLKKADALFRQILERQPDQVYAALGSAQVALNERRLEQADRTITAVLAKHQSSPEAHNMKGLVMMLQKRPELARQEFAKASELSPRYVTPRMYMAALSRASGNYAQAVADYTVLTELAPRLPSGHIGHAEALLMMGRLPDAIRVLEDWKGKDPGSVLPFQVLANLFIVNGDAPKAVEQLNSALAKKPTDSTTLVLLGAAYSAQGNKTAAVAQYEAALKADPKNTQAMIALGDLHARAGDTQKALARFRGVLKVDPGNVVASNNTAWLMLEEGADLNEALRLATSAIKRDPTYADAFDTLGWIHYRRRDYVRSIDALEKAKALRPDRLDVAAHLGLSLAKAGRRREAATELKRALGANPPLPNHEELRTALADLAASDRP